MSYSPVVESSVLSSPPVFSSELLSLSKDNSLEQG